MCIHCGHLNTSFSIMYIVYVQNKGNSKSNQSRFVKKGHLVAAVDVVQTSQQSSVQTKLL